MTVMETTTCFGLYWPSSGCLGNLRTSYMHARARGVEISTYTTGMTHFLDLYASQSLVRSFENLKRKLYSCNAMSKYAHVDISTTRARACI